MSSAPQFCRVAAYFLQNKESALDLFYFLFCFSGKDIHFIQHMFMSTYHIWFSVHTWNSDSLQIHFRFGVLSEKVRLYFIILDLQSLCGAVSYATEAGAELIVVSLSCLQKDWDTAGKDDWFSSRGHLDTIVHKIHWEDIHWCRRRRLRLVAEVTHRTSMPLFCVDLDNSFKVHLTGSEVVRY